MTDPGAPAPIRVDPGDDGEELLRAELYGLLARLWHAPPDEAIQRSFAVAVTQAPEPGSFLEGPWQDLVAAVRATTIDAAHAEHRDLFHGTGRAEILPYASHHLAGALNERPLVELRDTLATIGLEQAPSAADTEDHIAFIFEVMRYLIAGDDVTVCHLETQRRFFRSYVQSWVPPLCDAVEQHPRAHVYRELARLTRAFVDVEAQAFDIVDA